MHYNVKRLKMNEIENRVSNSGLITIDMEEMLPPISHFVELDIKDQLFQGIALKEKDFREFIKDNDWSVYQNKIVAVFCSEDAIIPTWAWMLLSAAIEPYTKSYFGRKEDVINQYILDKIAELNAETYQDARIVIKGCSKVSLRENAYMAMVNKLKPVAKSLLFGEPCSTVPIYKKPKE